MSAITGTQPKGAAALTLRLRPPGEGAGQLERRQLLPDPAGLAPIRLVLFRAPSGYGKTVSMGQMRRHLMKAGYSTAWITLNGPDLQPETLHPLLDLAVGQLEAAEGGPALTSPGPQPSPLERLVTLQNPFALFIDEAETIQDDTAPDLLREVLAELPDNGVLVIGTRRIPQNLGLARLRLRGQLLEFRPTELRFTPEETSAFLIGIEKLSLDQEALTRLQRRTEGWPAALRMASSAMRRQGAIPAFLDQFDGTDQAVGDYLTEQFLRELPRPLWQFLLRTSVLQDLSVPLCQAVCPETDARAALEGLASSNALITRLDGAGELYRCHNLLLSHLRARLSHYLPEGEEAELHRRAAAWFEAEGRIIPAIDHRLKAADYDRAIAHLRSEGVRLLQTGQLRRLSRWLAALPAQLLAGAPDLLLMQAWTTCLTIGPGAARQILSHPALQNLSDPAHLAEAACLRPMIRAMEDDFPGAEAEGREAMALMAQATPYARATTRILLANIRATLDRTSLPEAAPLDDDQPFSVIYGESVQAMSDLQDNRFLLAKARLRIAATTHPDDAAEGLNGNVWAGIPYALTLYECGNLTGTAQILRLQLPLALQAGFIDHAILAACHLSRIAFHFGEVDEAFAELVRLERYGSVRHLPRVVAGAGLERARLFQAQGNLRAAREQLRRLEDEALWQRIASQRLLANDLDTLPLAKIRLHLLEDEPAAALRLIAPELTDALGHRRHRRAMLLRLLEAAARYQTGARPEAFRLLQPVLSAAAREEYHRLLLDEGRPVAQLLEGFAAHGWQTGALSRDARFGDWFGTLRAALTPSDESSTEGDVPARPLDALTAKELQVLHLLAEGYSNAAMSEKLFVSDSTVRTHLRNINSKLGTASRTRAVAVARQMKLIP